MAGRGGGGGRKVLLPPIQFIFRLLQSRATVQIWLYEQLAIRIEGKIRVRLSRDSGRGGVRLLTRRIQGFDEFMNIVVEDAVEVKQITKTNKEETRRPLGMSRPVTFFFRQDSADTPSQARSSSRATTSRLSRAHPVERAPAHRGKGEGGREELHLILRHVQQRGENGMGPRACHERQGDGHGKPMIPCCTRFDYGPATCAGAGKLFMCLTWRRPRTA